jgi:hypothetical protein
VSVALLVLSSHLSSGLLPRVCRVFAVLVYGPDPQRGGHPARLSFRVVRAARGDRRLRRAVNQCSLLMLVCSLLITW